MKFDVRPWGTYWVLEESESYKVKRIEINPGGRLSYQYHNKRSEVWTIVSGNCIVTLDGIAKKYTIGGVIEIPLGTKHRIENSSNSKCIFIEVQTGTYFGEDDIVRLKDDYNRL